MDISANFQDIERKFLVESLPGILTDLVSFRCERYYLYADGFIDLRIQLKNDQYELERKIVGSNPSVRNSFKTQITEMEFFNLKKAAIGKPIVFQKYYVSSPPDVSIKKYEDDLKEFLIAEVGFDTLEDAKNFQPFEWMGREVSGESYARDSGLIYLTEPPIIVSPSA